MANLKHISRAYISKRLKEALGNLEYKRYNFICAPTGYGKSLVCHTFYKNYSKRMVLWVDANNTQEVFWNNLCSALKMIDATYANELLMAGFPKTEDDISRITYILDMFPAKQEEYMLIIDNFDNICNDMLYRLFSVNYIKKTLGISFVFLVRTISNHSIINLITKQEAGFAGEEELSFTPEDIKDYFRINEIIINDSEAQSLYKDTYGWPYAIEIYKDNYHNPDKTQVHQLTDAFIYTNIWVDKKENVQDFLLKMSVFKHFTLTQCHYQSGLSENECYDMLISNELIRHSVNDHTYMFNPIFRHFMLGMLDDKAANVIYDTTYNAAITYMSTKYYFESLELFSKINRYSEIYKSDIPLNTLYKYIIKENKDVFLNIANHYWETDKEGHYHFSIILCFIMFLYNEQNTLAKLINDISEDIKIDISISDIKRNNYKAALAYMKAFTEYNDFRKMNEHFLKVADITDTPTEIVGGQFPFTFECPSIMSLYHSKIGGLDYELLALEECAANYYRITNGHGKGFEALMKAEILYNRGDIDSAEILCHKAKYMADGRNQYSIYMAATFITTLIAIYRGANDEFNECMSTITNIANDENELKNILNKMADMCRSFIYSNLSSKDNMSVWLTDYHKIESMTNFHSLAFANIILGKYMILTGDYHKFLGISGQFLGLNKVHSYIVPNIYTYIYLTIANNETGDSTKAHKFMTEAVNLAAADRIYMPFVHNYKYIFHIFEEVCNTRELASFLRNVTRLSKQYEKGVKSINKAKRLLADYGLTVREADVAKLAAKRLTNKEIAEQLFIAESTVKSNMKMIFNKLQINSRAELKNFFE